MLVYIINKAVTNCPNAEKDQLAMLFVQTNLSLAVKQLVDPSSIQYTA
jgi:hypothetical protein